CRKCRNRTASRVRKVPRGTIREMRLRRRAAGVSRWLGRGNRRLTPAARREKTMRFGASRSQLYDAQKTARVWWDQTAELWGDVARREFEENVWVPLDEHVSGVLRAVDQLAVVFTQVRHECEFQG